jgi:hypothetical protein
MTDVPVHESMFWSRKYVFRLRLRIADPAPNNFLRYITLIGLTLSTIYKNFFSNHDFLINRNELGLEQEPQFVILATPPGGKLISAPRLPTLTRIGKKYQSAFAVKKKE